jgi:hypothetical protein
MYPEPIEVEAYSGYKYPEAPRAFIYQGKRYLILKVEKSWYEEKMKEKRRKIFFQVRTEDNRLWKISYQEAINQWFIEQKIE